MQHYANVEQSGTKDDEQDKQKSIEETGEEVSFFKNFIVAENLGFFVY